MNGFVVPYSSALLVCQSRYVLAENAVTESLMKFGQIAARKLCRIIRGGCCAMFYDDCDCRASTADFELGLTWEFFVLVCVLIITTS